MQAPAPAVVPLRLAMTGFGSARYLRISSHVIRVNSSKPAMSLLEQLADDVVHVAAGTERPAGAGDHDDAHILLIAQRAQRIRQLAITSNVSALRRSGGSK